MAKVVLRPEWHNMFLGLVVIAALWYVLRLHALLAGSLAAVTVVSTLVGGVVGSVVWGLGLVGMAVLAWVRFGEQSLAVVLGIVGVVYVALAALRKR